MKRPQPVVLATHRIHEETRVLLSQHCHVLTPDPDERFTDAALRSHLPSVDALMIFMPDRIDAHFLNDCARMRVIAGALKGCDQVDVNTCTERGIWVTVCQDLLTLPTAELAVGLAISLLRRMPEGDQVVRAGHGGWRPHLYGRSLIGARVGIVGMGRVGQAIAAMLAGFGCVIAYSDLSPLSPADEQKLAARRLDFDQLFAENEVIMLAAPLTAQSRHAINDRSLALMTPGTVIVNVGRGSVVDEQAVASALAAGRLWGYAADVFAFEDASLADRPAHIPPALLGQYRNTVFTPHLGSAVGVVRKAIEAEAAGNIISVLKGERPSGAVNRSNSTPSSLMH